MLIKEYNEESGTVFSIECNKLLYRGKSEYQKIEVYESINYGSILLLDNCFMITEKGFEQYHDKCVFLAKTKKKSLNILIIGGGDFGLVNKIFNSIDVKNIDVVEIDDKVIKICKKYFVNNFKLPQKNRKKVNIIIDDGYKYVNNYDGNKYDMIIIDCTDPNVIANKLYSTIFYKNIYNILSKNAIFIQQSGSPYLDVKKIIEPASRKLKKIGMRSLSVNSFSMPLYPLGMWSFIKCKKAQ